MPDETEQAGDKLRKLGRRLRQGIAQRLPLTDKQVEATRTAMREQWHLERAAKFVPPPPSTGREPKPPEPEQGR